MVSVDDIGWGRYKNFEGPFYRGKTRYEIPDNPDFLDKTLAVFTATEGGRFEALNMYDRCIISLGLIQFCGASPVFGVDKMLTPCAIQNKEKLDTYVYSMPAKPRFEDVSGKWRFKYDGEVVDNKEKQQKLFLGTDGAKGGWNSDTKLYAKQNAAVMASIFTDPEFQQIQLRYIKPRLLQFVLKAGNEIIFSRPDEDGWWGALKAAFVSFAGNLPTVANEQIKKAAENPHWGGASDEEKCIIALKTLTFGSGITIWPHRYNAIRKTLEKLFGIDLPDFADDLKAWDAEIGHPYFRTVEELQAALDFLGYDLGPAKVDGKFGEKTSRALENFEKDYGLEPDGLIDPVSSKKLYEEIQGVYSGDEVLGQLIQLSDRLMREGPDDIADILANIKTYE